ncbi:hypothetical protein M405DRAFT_70323 [Rhizopogon salebrosus TDB-379]|nr:hypothetical protein M405DRAFT_70323 [Rhizopogon salebrosus TDB-379]
MKNSAFFTLPHHLSYKPRYSSPALPLRISVVGDSRRRVFISPFFATPPFFILGLRCSFIPNVRHTTKPFFTRNPQIHQ